MNWQLLGDPVQEIDKNTNCMKAGNAPAGPGPCFVRSVYFALFHGKLHSAGELPKMDEIAVARSKFQRSRNEKDGPQLSLLLLSAGPQTGNSGMSILASCLKKVLVTVLGEQRFQRVLARNVDRCQLLMGIGAGADVLSSGERSIFDTLKRRCSPPYCIFDVGSNKGQFLQLILESLAPDQVSVHCFEPGAATFKILARSCTADKGIRLNNLGIGKEEGEALLHYNVPGSGIASLTKRRLDHFDIHFTESETVAITTIDRYCLKSGIDRIHLLKLDIEGHELDAWRAQRKCSPGRPSTW